MPAEDHGVPEPSDISPLSPPTQDPSAHPAWLVLPAWITALAVVVGVGWFIVVGNKPVAAQHVLILSTTEDPEEAFPASAFDEALKKGGQVTVQFTDIRDAHPEIETFSPGKDGSYLTYGALVNYVTSKGWRFHGLQLGGMTVFVR